MANAVELSNLALSHLGSDANVASISPPDGSVEAGYCARYFPIARRVMLTTFEWSFATKRAELAEVTNQSDVWTYAYATPADCLKPWRVLKAGAADEQDGAEFVWEDGVIYTHEPNAVLKYSRDVTDTTRFTPQFDSAISWLLASYLAGPIIKGNEGANASVKLLQRAMQEGATAGASNANSATVKHGGVDQVPDHLKVRA